MLLNRNHVRKYATNSPPPGAHVSRFPDGARISEFQQWNDVYLFHPPAHAARVHTEGRSALKLLRVGFFDFKELDPSDEKPFPVDLAEYVQSENGFHTECSIHCRNCIVLLFGPRRRRASIPLKNKSIFSVLKAFAS
jgi:hypothetical protein